MSLVHKGRGERDGKWIHKRPLNRNCWLRKSPACKNQRLHSHSLTGILVKNRIFCGLTAVYSSFPVHCELSGQILRKIWALGAACTGKWLVGKTGRGIIQPSVTVGLHQLLLLSSGSAPAAQNSMEMLRSWLSGTSEQGESAFP